MTIIVSGQIAVHSVESVIAILGHIKTQNRYRGSLYEWTSSTFINSNVFISILTLGLLQEIFQNTTVEQAWLSIVLGVN